MKNFINDTLADLRRPSMESSGAPRKGLLKESWKAPNLGKGLFKEACKANNSEGVVEGGLEFKILVGCRVLFMKRMVLASFRTISETRLPRCIK